jgi:hypothetical protein
VVDFIEDVNQSLWMVGVYSQEYNDFLLAQTAGGDEVYEDSPNK